MNMQLQFEIPREVIVISKILADLAHTLERSNLTSRLKKNAPRFQTDPTLGIRCWRSR